MAISDPYKIKHSKLHHNSALTWKRLGLRQSGGGFGFSYSWSSRAEGITTTGHALRRKAKRRQLRGVAGEPAQEPCPSPLRQPLKRMCRTTSQDSGR